MLSDKEVEAAERTLSYPIHPGPFPNKALEFLENFNCRFEMTRRTVLLNADFSGLKLPPDMVVHVGKSQVTEACRNCPDVEVDVLPT
jgi:hypothetical protein